MKRHVFLTGEKQIGKSTLIKKVLSRYEGSVGGFLTLRTGEYLKNEYSVHMYSINEKAVPSASNYLFRCASFDENASSKFNAIGCHILKTSAGSSLIIMDELGRREASASSFRKAVIKALDSESSVLGVLQHPADAYWPEVIKRPDTAVIELTAENRNDPGLISVIQSVISLPL